MIIRHANKQTDSEGIWNIFKAVVSTGDTYAFDPLTSKEGMEKYWFGDSIDSFVAVEDDKIVATYFIKPNQPGLGSHIANCGYMVSPAHHGRGLGHKLCEHSLKFAKEKGYLGMQFNIVVSTNVVAVRLWEKFGFKIIGTTPNGFRHQTLGLVDSHIMFRSLE